MMFKKNIMGLIITVSLFGIYSISHANIFSDSFDDLDFTNSNWLDGNPLAPQTWSFETLNGSDLGWHATVDSLNTLEPASKIANNGQEYYNAGLYIETLVRMDSHAGIDTTQDEKILLGFSAGDDGAYLVTIQQKFDGDRWRGLLYFGTHSVPGQSSSDENLVEDPVAIDFDTFYKLVVQVDLDENIDVFLYDLDNALLGSVSSPKALISDKGSVGIGGRYESTFNNFYLSGTSVSSCQSDFPPPDGDVDGTDLANYISDSAGISLNDFAAEFGRVDCF